jgi:hypothetical protein
MTRMRDLAFIPLNAQFGGVHSRNPRKLAESCAKARSFERLIHRMAPGVSVHVTGYEKVVHPAVRDPMDADKTRSDALKRSDSSALEQDVMRVLLDPSEPNADEIDDLITRCAAEALRLRGAIGPIEAERRRLYELAAELRVRRERANQ